MEKEASFFEAWKEKERNSKDSLVASNHENMVVSSYLQC